MKSKILFMVQVPPPVHGASLRNLSLFESRLLQDTYNIKLLPLAFADNIGEIGKFGVGKVLKSFRYAWNLARTLVSFKPDIAYFTITPAGGAFYRDCLFVFILKLYGVRIIYHLRGIGIEAARHSGAVNKALYNFVFRDTNVVCLSKKHIADISGLPYKKYFIVPNGIKVETEENHTVSKSSHPTRLLYLSNFIKTKGVYEFLHALKALHLQNIPFEATLIGADSDVKRKDIQAYIDQAGLANNTRVTGPCYKEEKFRAINSCDIFVFPTYYRFELFPGVILEAMQCYKPVISTYHGVIEDIIDDGETGLLVHPRDVDQLVEKMKFLIKNPEQAQLLGQRAGEKFYQNYTLDKFEANVRNVFDEVLKS